jgi:two-component system, OmpR family, response regulator
METTIETMNKPLSVFLVDDDKMFLLSLKHKLIDQFKDVKFFTFTSGEECLENIDKNPDVVVLDYYLSEDAAGAMDGLDVLKKIKSVSNNIRVIMLSAQDKLNIAVESIKYGASEYVVKSETAFVRVQNSIKNLLNTISYSKDRKKYETWNYVIAFILLALILINLIYYVNHF